MEDEDGRGRARLYGAVGDLVKLAGLAKGIIVSSLPVVRCIYLGAVWFFEYMSICSI
jgi:hypothetical protein